MTIGERIKQRRKDLGLSADNLADKLGVSRSTIYRYENGFIEKLPMDFLIPLSEALLTSPAYIMGWDDMGKIDYKSTPGYVDVSSTDPDALAINMYKSLDSDDKAEIRGEMKQMLKADKYSKKGGSFGA